MMDGEAFDFCLIPEFSGTTTDMPIVEWTENVEMVCDLCAVDMIEQLQGSALAVYSQLSKEQIADVEQIKQSLMTMYATDAFNAYEYDQFITRQLCSDETMDKFLAELHRLARLVEESLPE